LQIDRWPGPYEGPYLKTGREVAKGPFEGNKPRKARLKHKGVKGERKLLGEGKGSGIGEEKKGLILEGLRTVRAESGC